MINEKYILTMTPTKPGTNKLEILSALGMKDMQENVITKKDIIFKISKEDAEQGVYSKVFNLFRLVDTDPNMRKGQYTAKISDKYRFFTIKEQSELLGFKLFPKVVVWEVGKSEPYTIYYPDNLEMSVKIPRFRTELPHPNQIITQSQFEALKEREAQREIEKWERREKRWERMQKSAK
jgi:hypothetical protein